MTILEMTNEAEGLQDQSGRHDGKADSILNPTIAFMLSETELWGRHQKCFYVNKSAGECYRESLPLFPNKDIFISSLKMFLGNHSSLSLLWLQWCKLRIYLFVFGLFEADLLLSLPTSSFTCLQPRPFPIIGTSVFLEHNVLTVSWSLLSTLL